MSFTVTGMAIGAITYLTSRERTVNAIKIGAHKGIKIWEAFLPITKSNTTTITGNTIWKVESDFRPYMYSRYPLYKGYNMNSVRYGCNFYTNKHVLGVSMSNAKSLYINNIGRYKQALFHLKITDKHRIPNKYTVTYMDNHSKIYIMHVESGGYYIGDTLEGTLELYPHPYFKYMAPSTIIGMIIDYIMI